MNERAHEGAVWPGQVFTLTQPSVRRREYELRRGDQVLDWLRFPPGRRSAAFALGDATGPVALVATAGGVEVHGGAARGDDDRHGGARTPGRRGASHQRGSALGWRWTGPGHRWAIDGDEGTLLRFAARWRLLRSSVRITAQQELPARTAVLLSLIGGFLALSTLQAELDGSAAAAGIATAGAG